MTEQMQVLYRGKFAAARPTAEQLALLERMGIKKEVIESLNRQAAFELIRKCITQYYEEKVQRRFNGKIAVKW